MHSLNKGLREAIQSSDLEFTPTDLCCDEKTFAYNTACSLLHLYVLLGEKVIVDPVGVFPLYSPGCQEHFLSELLFSPMRPKSAEDTDSSQVQDQGSTPNVYCRLVFPSLR